MTSGHFSPGDATSDDSGGHVPSSGGSPSTPGTHDERIATGDALPATHQSGSELEERFADPGLPAHVHRRSDTDPQAARRAERQIAAMFGLSTLGTLVFVVGLVAIKLEDGIRDATYSTLVLGGGLTLALFFIGAAAIHWAKTLMPDDEMVEERHPIRSTDEERAEAVRVLAEGGAGAGFGRRRLIWGSMLGAFGAIALVPLVSLRDLGPLPKEALRHTVWKKGTRLVRDPTGEPIRVSDVPIGGVLHVLPQHLEGEGGHSKESGGGEGGAGSGEGTTGGDGGEGSAAIEDLNERAKASVLLIKLSPEDINQRSDPNGWSYSGLVAYSKICTHAGCPVGLYEQQTHHLLCPCHQSTFDVLDHCNVIFGPAARPLPQLAIEADADGYLVAREDFREPVGPSFWERG